jgi:hypothetical protein
MSFVPDLARSCRENDELIADLARFSEGIYSETAVRRKYRDLLSDDDWAMLGADDLLVEMIEAEKLRRVRNGAFKRERAQQHVTKAPDILEKILSDERASPKHRIDAAKTLDDLADNGPQTAAENDRIHIVINLGGDERLVFDKAIKPTPAADTVIDRTPKQIEATPEMIPPKRGPGRPPGSKNKPKTETAPQELLPFVAAKTPDGGGDGNAI